MRFRPRVIIVITLGLVAITVAVGGRTTWAHVKIPVPVAVVLPNLLLALLVASIVAWIATGGTRRS